MRKKKKMLSVKTRHNRTEYEEAGKLVSEIPPPLTMSFISLTKLFSL